MLARKYGAICPPDYIAKVVGSIQKDPVELRPLRYLRQPVERPLAHPHDPEPIALIVNDRHDIHHIRERGYVESPVRISAILSELTPTGLFETVQPKEYPIKYIQATHDPELVDYLKQTCKHTPAGKSVYPYVFPIRNKTRPPKDLSIRAGYYCIDTFTPINNNVSGTRRLRGKRPHVEQTRFAHRHPPGRRLSYSNAWEKCKGLFSGSGGRPAESLMPVFKLRHRAGTAVRFGRLPDTTHHRELS